MIRLTHSADFGWGFIVTARAGVLYAGVGFWTRRGAMRAAEKKYREIRELYQEFNDITAHIEEREETE